MLLITMLSLGCGSGGDVLSVGEFNSRIHASTQIQLVDVRTPGEYAEGHLEGAINIDYNGDNFSEEIEALTKTMAVYVYCRSGGRSARAAGVLSEKGFTEVYDLKGGILSWQEKGLPVKR